MNFFIADAMAQTAATPGGQAFNWIFLAGMVLVFYFLLIRPQMKRQKEHQNLIASLAKGDEAVTQGGVLGKVTEVGENFVSLEVADGVRVKVQKHMVAAIMPKGTIKSS